MVRGSLMRALGRCGIVANVGIEDGEERINDVSYESQAGEGGGYGRPSI